MTIADDFIFRIEQAGFNLAVTETGDLAIAPFSRLTDQQRQFIRAHKPALVRALTSKAQHVTTIVHTSQGRYSVDMELNATQEQIAEAIPKLAVVHYRLKDGEGAGTLLAPGGLQSALEKLRKQYGDQLESTTYVGRYTAENVSKETRARPEHESHDDVEYRPRP